MCVFIYVVRLRSEKSGFLVKKFAKEKRISEFGKFLVWEIFGVEMKPPYV